MTNLFSASPGVWTIVTSVSSSGLVSAVISHMLGKRRDGELEKLKDTLSHGSYVSRSQYDLELGAYQELWAAMSSLRLNVRTLQSDDLFHLAECGDWYPESFSTIVESFAKSHNEALVAADKFAPFYTPEIYRAVMSISARDVQILNFIGADKLPTFSEKWKEELRNRVNDVLEGTDKVEDAIRNRLNGLRIIP